MTIIATSSDNHFDINKVDVDIIIDEQVNYLLARNIEYYLITGDLFNDFNKTIDYIIKLKKKLNNKIVVLFIAGNHDMVKNVTFDELESVVNDSYLHNQYLDISGTEWRIIGNNGWYDYSYSKQLKRSDKEMLHWKTNYWIDRKIVQPMSDVERFKLSLRQTEKLLCNAKQLNKKIIFMTHFVPNELYIKINNDNRFWNVANGMLGSQKMGNLLEYYKVEKVLFGHLHIKHDPIQVNETMYYTKPVGYGRKKYNEWTKNTFFDEWKFTLQIINLK
ncbi:metallophosphoesterase [Dellaglioa sp. P0083]|uniref:metallophosphoesterase n=1 Tax=Dellaglioa kimchii TaxID=3344667 RepID=UPI0038D44281